MATETTDVRAVGDRLDALVGELGALADPRARAKAEEVVRLLMHLNTEKPSKAIVHVYLREARALRPDIHSAQ